MIPLKTIKEPDIKLSYYSTKNNTENNYLKTGKENDNGETEKTKPAGDEANSGEKIKEGKNKDENKQNDKKNHNKEDAGKNASGKKNEDEKNEDKENGEESSKEKSRGYDKNQAESETEISKNLSENLNFIKKVYSIPTNSDIVLREFEIALKEETVKAFAIFFDGMVDRMVINMAILEPLMLLSNLPVKGSDKDITEYIMKHLMPHTQLKVTKKYGDVIKEVNFGGCGVFIDGFGVAIAADTKGWEHRGVDRPNTELVIRGPQEGFTELLRVNTALLRKILKDSDLIAESINIGLRSQTSCAMMYIKDIANDGLVDEVRKRLKSIKTDYIFDSGELEQYIEDSAFFPMPQVIATERPDRVASLLAEGRVAIIVDGSPFVLVVPATFATLLHSPEDIYSRFPYGNFHKIIRLLAIFLSIFLPGLYIAITNYHQEMIPTDLLLAIAASREKVPFPSVLEILIMEISFELIREAGIRIPGPIGPTLGIIGALILGQAAVAANIVSPILIIIVAVTGIGSFGVPNFSSAFSFRITRFFYIILGSMAGFLGITVGLFIHFIWLVSFNSFGIPFMVPFAPRTVKTSHESFTRRPVWKQERRPDYLNPKDIYSQPEKSRGWVRSNSKGERADKDEK
ncbi:MAG TPA: spore germination protein [Clostridiaceae bacterium]|nr:spore germination protein [Clostridiaceae bacterium]